MGLKISKSAVVRNRLRRRLGEMVRLLKKDDRLAVGYYIMVVPEKAALLEEYAELARQLEQVLKSAQILRPKH